jgi:membrane protein YqaA with SNARE-associated domain
VLALSAHRHAPRYLAGVSFAESSVFPIPPDAMLIPMCIARPERAYYYAFVCTIASVLGGVAGYAIGYFLFEALAEPVLRAYGHADALLRFQGWYRPLGRARHPHQGADADPLQDRHHRLGRGEFDF